MMVNLANAFAGRGIPVDMVLARARGPFLAEVAPEVGIVDLNSSGVVRGLPRLIRYLRETRPAALLSTLNHASIVAIWARRLAGVPVRVFVREADTLSQFRHASLKSRLMPSLVRRFYPWADRVVAVSQGVADDLVTFGRLPHDKVVTIYNPVVTPDIAERAAAPLAHPWFEPGQPPVVLGAGRLTAQKDFPTLIAAFARVRERLPARLVILGEGEDRAKLERQVAALGLASDVDLPGFVDNPFAYMARAGVFALSSRWEGLPGVLIQALACGCPVVSTACPSGPAEVLDGGRIGPLVPVGEAPALADAIVAQLEAPTPAALLRERSALFARDASVDAYLDLLLGGSARAVQAGG